MVRWDVTADWNVFVCPSILVEEEELARVVLVADLAILSKTRSFKTDESLVLVAVIEND